MAEPTPLLLSNIAHKFGNTAVLNALNLSVKAGEFVALLGPSGCGKTTLLRAIAGLVTPNAGTITIDGKVVADDGIDHIPCENRGVGLVFQEYALFPNMTVAQNVGYGLPSPDSARVNGLLTLVGMADLGLRMPAQLSGGQQQRVALARALAPRPALLLLDEPFANVDAALKDTMGRLLRRVVQDEGATVLMVTHDQQSALSLADRVVIFGPQSSGSTIVQDASPTMVYHQPETAAVALMTGACALIDGDAQGAHAQTLLGQVPLVRPQNGSIRLVLRPEQLHFIENESGLCTVNDVQFSGAVQVLRCGSEAGPIDVLLASSIPAPAVGTRGNITVSAPAWALAHRDA